MNEIKAADANTGYGARGVPAFTYRFVSKTQIKWQKLAAPHMYDSHEKSQRMKPLRVSCAGFIANKALLLRASLAL
jgi:hypothetical protein